MGIGGILAKLRMEIGALSDGQVVARTFPLQDHVTAQVITQLQALALDLRTKAQALLP